MLGGYWRLDWRLDLPPVVEEPNEVAGSWGSAGVSLDPWAGTRVRILFEAADGGAATTVEAGIDDVRVTRPGG